MINVLSRTVLNALNGRAHFAGGLHGFFCQFAHFVGHYGKTASGLASAGRFNGGVQGQQVGLVCYV